MLGGHHSMDGSKAVSLEEVTQGGGGQEKGPSPGRQEFSFPHAFHALAACSGLGSGHSRRRDGKVDQRED